MLPLCPLKVMVPELDPEQTVALELVDPPTVLQLTQVATKHQFLHPPLQLESTLEPVGGFKPLP
jgi:hypothetical protein